MRLFTVILIWISLTIQCFVQLGIVQWYEWNKASITQLYCVNKDKPAMKCDGKCYLKKKLQKTEDEQQKGKSVSKEAEWTVCVLPAPIQMPAEIIYEYISRYAITYPGVYVYSKICSIFHPPRLT